MSRIKKIDIKKNRKKIEELSKGNLILELTLWVQGLVTQQNELIEHINALEDNVYK